MIRLLGPAALVLTCSCLSQVASAADDADKQTTGDRAVNQTNRPEYGILFEEQFAYPDGDLPAMWWSEGDKAAIKDGRLFVDADKGRNRCATVWCKQEFSGDLRIEYDACVLSSADKANNLNLFLLYSDPTGKLLYDSRGDRSDGRYNLYHHLSGYILTNVANGNESRPRYRLRDCPGFNLIEESFGKSSVPNRVYHIVVEKQGNRFRLSIDGVVVLDAEDEQFSPAHEAGLLGFRTWHTALWWDNLKVTRISRP